MHRWILPLAFAMPLACGSAPNDALSNRGNGVGNATGGSVFIGSGGAPSSGGATAASGGTAVLESGGIPNGAGGVVNTGGFNSGGVPFDGSVSTGGFLTGGAGPIEAGPSGGTGSIDARPACLGRYSGTLTGAYTSVLGSATFTARIEFTVEADGNITGTLTGTSDPTSRATLDGRVDCASGQSTINIENGSYRAVLGTTQYSGTMVATYDSTKNAFIEGTWVINESSSTGSGNGTWSAK